MEATSKEIKVEGKFCKAFAHTKTIFIPLKKNGKVVVNKKGNPVRIPVRSGGIVLEDAFRVIHHPFSFRKGSFGEKYEKPGKNSRGNPDKIQDGNFEGRIRPEDMKARLSKLLGNEGAKATMSLFE